MLLIHTTSGSAVASTSSEPSISAAASTTSQDLHAAHLHELRILHLCCYPSNQLQALHTAHACELRILH
eukprot:1159604-Pelagomonas_calceolata.AAC.3